jgi:hypothetical protein
MRGFVEYMSGLVRKMREFVPDMCGFVSDMRGFVSDMRELPWICADISMLFSPDFNLESILGEIHACKSSLFTKKKEQGK